MQNKFIVRLNKIYYTEGARLQRGRAKNKFIARREARFSAATKKGHTGRAHSDHNLQKPAYKV